MALKIGDSAPDFCLPGVDGKEYSLSSFAGARVLVVVFTCNHCPYAQAYEDRLIELAEYYSVQRVQFVAINPNDAEGYPEDSFEGMRRRQAKKRFPYPYLRDESQAVAKAYGATVTPELFVFDKDRALRYHGRIDDCWRSSEKVKNPSLKIAISTLLSGNSLAPDVAEQPAMGCTIKWKWGD